MKHGHNHGIEAVVELVHYGVGAFAGRQQPGKVVEIGEAEVQWVEEGCFDHGLEGFDSDGAVGLT